MATTMRYEPNPAFEAEMRLDPEFRRSLAATAGAVIDAVRQIAPERTGNYRRSFEVGTDSEGQPVVVTHSPIWNLIEDGSVHNRPFATIRTAVTLAGLEFRP